MINWKDKDVTEFIQEPTNRNFRKEIRENKGEYITQEKIKFPITEG